MILLFCPVAHLRTPPISQRSCDCWRTIERVKQDRRQATAHTASWSLSKRGKTKSSYGTNTQNPAIAMKQKIKWSLGTGYAQSQMERQTEALYPNAMGVLQRTNNYKLYWPAWKIYSTNKLIIALHIMYYTKSTVAYRHTCGKFSPEHL